MSFWTTIEGEAKKLWSAVKAEFANPNIYTTAATDVRALSPVVAGILAAEDPAVAAIVVPVGNEVAKDLTLVASILAAAQQNPNSSKLALLGGIFDGMVANLTGLLTAGHIKNATLIAQINAMVQEIEVIKGMLFPQAKAASA